ncbi:putative ABC transporter permease [Xiamenia xianingshaonis]|uniref:putative ABC transporter permease n=1 Tax=Xiamenia xianingshaonis TaxID=2682776 RepID=UPI0028F74078|nr:putative ABC transporter permease [Xiamenia xianingshaonis]
MGKTNNAEYGPGKGASNGPLERLARQAGENLSDTREEWDIELHRDAAEAKDDAARAVQEAKGVAQTMAHPSRLAKDVVREAERIERGASEAVQAATHPKEAFEHAEDQVKREFQKIADAKELIGEDLSAPIDKQQLPLLMKVYGWLCIASALIVLAGTVRAAIASAALFEEGAMESLGASTTVVTFVHLGVVALLAVAFFVFGTRLLRNQRRFAAYLAYGIYLLMLLGLLCSLMLEGVTYSLGVYVAVFAVTVAAQSYLDPSLRDERKLHRLLRAREDLAQAEAGTLGRDPEGKGYIALNFFNLFWVFVASSVLGLFMEEIVHFLIVAPGQWQDRAGLLFGPFSPIYGCGAVLMTLFLNRLHKKSLILVFVLSALVGGAFEYFTSWFMQYTYGAVAWDYTGQWLSIGGRTCGWAMGCWGLLGCVWIKLLLPLLLHVINLVPWNWRYSLTTAAAALMLVDAIMSLQALDCWYERLSGQPVDTPIERFYAQHFDNAFMSDRFQSMTINPDDAARHSRATGS